MSINIIFCFLVHPGKSEEESNIRGTTIPLEGPLFSMLQRAYTRTQEECKHKIYFVPDENNSNPCRKEILSVIHKPNLEQAKTIAKRIESVTTHRSGLGLLFIVIGKSGNRTKIYIARFPAETGIVAEEGGGELFVQFVEKVFMKNPKTFKAVAYEGVSFDSDFWNGRAVDNQLNDPSKELSNYWISDFLHSDLLDTSATGTKRLANALKEALEKTEDENIKKEILATTVLANNLDGKVINLNEFADRLNLSPATREIIKKKFEQPRLALNSFLFSVDIFNKVVPYRTVVLDNDAILTAPTSKFDSCFEVELMLDRNGKYRFSTEGNIVDEKLRKSK